MADMLQAYSNPEKKTGGVEGTEEMRMGKCAVQWETAVTFCVENMDGFGLFVGQLEAWL